MYVIESITVTRCAECGNELRDATDAALCARKHTLEYLTKTEEGRRTFQQLLDAGFKDEPDPWLAVRRSAS